MPRGKRKQPGSEPEITAWPSGRPDELGSIAPPGSELSLEYEELGSRFLSDAVEQSYSEAPPWYEEHEDVALETHLGPHMIRALLHPELPRERSTMRPNYLAPPRPPSLEEGDYEAYLVESGEVDLTSENIREASLLDHEADEMGETESPFVRTDDTHTHGKRRGGHAPQRTARSRR